MKTKLTPELYRLSKIKKLEIKLANMWPPSPKVNTKN